MSARPTPMTDEQIARNLRDGHLSPWAAPVTGALGWQVTTPSRRLAVAVATVLTGGTVHSHKRGEWQTCIPQAVLMVVVIGADADTLRCRLSAQPHFGVFAVAFTPGPAAAVLECPLTVLPVRGQLSVRDVRLTTRMGRIVRYLVPVFTRAEPSAVT
jgi:hypothetical protein